MASGFCVKKTPETFLALCFGSHLFAELKNGRRERKPINFIHKSQVSFSYGVKSFIRFCSRSENWLIVGDGKMGLKMVIQCYADVCVVFQTTVYEEHNLWSLYLVANFFNLQKLQNIIPCNC